MHSESKKADFTTYRSLNWGIQRISDKIGVYLRTLADSNANTKRGLQKSCISSAKTLRKLCSKAAKIPQKYCKSPVKIMRESLKAPGITREHHSFRNAPKTTPKGEW